MTTDNNIITLTSEHKGSHVGWSPHSPTLYNFDIVNIIFFPFTFRLYIIIYDNMFVLDMMVPFFIYIYDVNYSDFMGKKVNELYQFI